MTDEQVLLATVLAFPEDDTPRLMYADELDAVGEGDRAEYIRTAIEHARAGETECGHRVTHDPGGWNAACLVRCGACDFCARIQFLEAAGRRHAPDLPVGYVWTHEESPELVHQHPTTWPVVIFRRGWIDEVRCRLADWTGGECPGCDGRGGWGGLDGDDAATMCLDCSGTGRTPGIGPEVVRRHPVQVVRLSDREPGQYENTREWYWSEWTPDVTYPISTLPPDVFGELAGTTHVSQLGTRTKHYPTRDAALAALSRAAIAWARSHQPASGESSINSR